jgi:hypothetical protein
MKTFIDTKFFRILLDTSQKDVDIGIPSLENSYKEFVEFLLENTVFKDKVIYHNTLVYTLVDLLSITEVTKKKHGNLYSKSH